MMDHIASAGKMVAERRERITAARRAQPLAELTRKADKAQRRGLWTQEELDWSQAEARELAKWFQEEGQAYYGP